MTLSLSGRTVETHVSRVLAKLGVWSRHEVAGSQRRGESEHEQARPSMCS